jgi:hypothetical protein
LSDGFHPCRGWHMCRFAGAASTPRSSGGGLHGLQHAGVEVLDCTCADGGRPQQLEKDLIPPFSLQNTLLNSHFSA